ncbi:restriction endonuclease [[Clostridium] innocuum]|uniref:restriction endonuclease n=1 Tax=Clostridium innocuum TaxID=1522 RepID=UPI000AAEF858|nr:restriction endonuclease [[Clostridium] innocuum]
MKYLTDWNAFKENGSFNGNLFEDLVKELLACMYPNVIWEQTKKSWDGNKDFVSKGLHSNEKWAECKCYKKKLDLKVLAPTLVMSTVSNIKDILIFSYSEINTNAKRKIAQFAESQEATIIVYENEVLEELILKYQDVLNIEIYFPSFKKCTYTDLALQNQLSFLNSRIMKEQSWRELKKERLRINDIIKITVTVCNSSLKSVDCSLEIKKYEKNMAMLTPSKIDSVLKGGEIKCYYFHMQINHYDNLIKMPEVYLNKIKILSAFSITCDWLLEKPLIGCINECEKIKNVLNSSQNNNPHTFLITPDLDASLCNWIKLLIANLYDLPIIDIAFAETQIMDTGSLLTNILYNSKFQFTVHKNEIIRLLLSKIASLPRRSTPTSAPTSKRKSCTIKTQEIS